MRILMLGNSFIFVNDLPTILAELTGAEVVSNTRGGARLAEQLNPNTKMGARTQKALQEEKWDYVVLQEMSKGPAVNKERFLETASALCQQIQAAGAKPVFYATWSYERNGPCLAESGFDYDELYHLLYEGYHQAAQDNHALIADVGTAFYEAADQVHLFAEDGCHPNLAGTNLAAKIIAKVILEDWEHLKNPQE